ncbi:MAG: epimerase [Microbacterium sp. SCN 70-200]|uniref:DUF1304 domain-containing protein n=1 Tax=unclassified Microbacterium TaxID=2609290 RepID=UPI00086E05FD|nr:MULTISPECIES: DUF1304 domain-containing protein [unclassified Microbacterium]MBN9216201.1 DUF1304 domain-containing protein [Microbacterium sp.]ODT41814.1 MAG: epimerase [Microbacterium sp. SCN 70-200]OJV84503.1 MAG: epimerase [Microbacterium sp. 70-16]
MIITGLVFAGLAALLHVYIFWMESLAWDGPQARKTFGVPDHEIEPTRAFAYNQGFYNLFLAIAAIVGIIVTAAGDQAVGLTLILAGTGSMLAAALVLLLSSPDKRRAAITQGFLPLLAVVFVVIGLLV